MASIPYSQIDPNYRDKTARALPTYDGHQVALSNMSVGGISYADAGSRMAKDNSNLAAKTTHALDNLAKAADSIQDRIDQSRVLDLTTQMREYAMIQERGEDGQGGYSMLKGGSALEADANGRGLAQSTMEDFDKHYADISQKFTSRQVALARQQMESIRQGAYTAVTSHVARQFDVYTDGKELAALGQSDKEAYNGAGSNALLNTGYTAKMSILDGRASRLGWSKEQIAQAKLEEGSKFWGSAVLRLLDDAKTNPQAAQRAIAILNAHGKQMTGTDVSRLRDSAQYYIDVLRTNANIEAFVQQQKNFSDPFIQGATAAMGLGKIENGRYVFEAAIRGQSNLNNDGTVRKDRFDEGNAVHGSFGIGNASLKNMIETAKRRGVTLSETDLLDSSTNIKWAAQYFEDCVAAAGGDTTKALAYFYTDKATVDAAEKKAESEGKPFTEYLSKAAQGAITTASQKLAAVQGGAASGKSITDPDYVDTTNHYGGYDEARKWVLANDRRAAYDPIWCEKQVQAIVGRETQRKTDDKRQFTERLVSAQNAIAQANGDMSAVNPDLLKQFTPRERAQLEAYASRLAKGNKSPIYESLGMYDGDDNKLKSLSRRELEAMKSAWGDQWDRMALKWGKLNGESVKEAERRGQSELAKRGVTGAVDMSEFAPTSGQIRTALKGIYGDSFDDKKFNDIVSVIGERVMELGYDKGRTLKPGEVEAEVKRLVATEFYIDDGFFSDTLVTGRNIKAADLPNRGPTDAAGIVRGLAKMMVGGNREPDDNEVQRAYLQLLYAKNPGRYFAQVSPAGLVLDKDVANAARKRYNEKAFAAERLKEGAVNWGLIREYVLIRASGDTSYSVTNGALDNLDVLHSY